MKTPEKPKPTRLSQSLAVLKYLSAGRPVSVAVAECLLIFADKGPLTAAEVCFHAGRTSASTTVSKMSKDDLIREHGKKRQTAIAYELTEYGKAEVEAIIRGNDGVYIPRHHPAKLDMVKVKCYVNELEAMR